MDDETVDQQQQTPQQSTPAPTQPAAPAQQPVSAQQPAPAQAAAPAIKPVTPVRRGGLAGIVDELRDAISGTTTPRIHQDAEGNQYIHNDDLSSGQKWLRVIGTGIRGAAAGMAAGQGPGGAARAFQAGVEAGDKQRAQQRQTQQEQSEEVKQQQLEKFNAIKQQHDLAAQNFEMTRRQIAASRSDMEFAQQQLNQELKPREQGGYGSIDLGTAKDYKEFADRMQATRPDFWKQVYAGDGNNIKQYPEFDESGKQVGIHVVLRTEDISKQPAPQGATFKRFVPGDQPGTLGHLEDVTPSGMHTVGELETWTNAALSQQNQERITAANLAEKQALTDQHNSAANANDARAENLENGGTGRMPKKVGGAGTGLGAVSGGNTPANDDEIVRQIGTGQMGIGNWGYVLSRMKDPQFARKVTAAYPDMDTARIQAYQEAYKNYTSTKATSAGGQINAGATALEHLYNLQKLNTMQSHIPGTPAWNAYHNQLDTLAPELAKFYGDTTVPAIASLKSTLGANLPGNRQAAISTQAISLGKKFDNFEQSWGNASPSRYYKPPMPGVSEEAKQARAALDPHYAARMQGQQQGGGQQAQQQQQKHPQQQAPSPQTHQFSVSAWQQANPHGDVNAAKAAAQQQGYQVVQ